MSEKTRHIPLENGATIVLKERFRQSTLARFRQEAPELVCELVELFYNNSFVDAARKELIAIDDEEERNKRAQELAQEAKLHAAESMAQATTEVPLRTTVDQLEAWHRFCVEVTEAVEGYEFKDDDGKVCEWRHLDGEDRLDFYDFEVGGTAKVAVFIHCYNSKVQ